MDEPNARKSRLALAGGVAAALVFAGGGFLIGRTTSSRDAAPAATPRAPAAPVAVATEPASADPGDAVQTRADLLAVAARAADALASGGAMPRAVLDMAGRRFELRLPFGCRGPSPEDSDAAMRWRYDEAAGALRVRVSPVVWTGDEPAEGFWIPRPWTASEACPPAQDEIAPVGAEAVTLPGQTVGIGQIGSDDGRGGGKPYEAVVRMAPDEVPAGQGLRLRVSGRIAAPAGRPPVACRQPAGAEQRPICIIAVTLDTVAIENPRTGRVLATWDVGKAGTEGS